MTGLLIRKAGSPDLASIQQIYNQGIDDRTATLDTEPKDATYMKKWLTEHRAGMKYWWLSRKIG